VGTDIITYIDPMARVDQATGTAYIVTSLVTALFLSLYINHKLQDKEKDND